MNHRSDDLDLLQADGAQDTSGHRIDRNQCKQPRQRVDPEGQQWTDYCILDLGHGQPHEFADYQSPSEREVLAAFEGQDEIE